MEYSPLRPCDKEFNEYSSSQLVSEYLSFANSEEGKKLDDMDYIMPVFAFFAKKCK